jgi:hypothetical protein
MNNIKFNQTIVDWINNSGQTVLWQNDSSQFVNWSSDAQANNSIRYADFIRITTGVDTYRFTTAPADMTVSAVDANAFDAVGVLIKVGEAQRDIKSTANETTITMTGIDTAMLGWVLGQNVKGAKIEMWHGFFNPDGSLITSGGTGGLYQFFNGFINSFSISEQWMEDARAYVGTVTVSAAAIQLILQNRTAGRYTNNNSWQFFNAGDTSMNRVGFIETINYQFGQNAPPNS